MENELHAMRFPDGTIIRSADIEAFGPILVERGTYYSDKPIETWGACYVYLGSRRELKIRLTDVFRVVWQSEQERLEEIKTRAHIVREQLMRQIFQIEN